jgi:hypothetical protein
MVALADSEIDFSFARAESSFDSVVLIFSVFLCYAQLAGGAFAWQPGYKFRVRKHRANDCYACRFNDSNDLDPAHIENPARKQPTVGLEKNRLMFDYLRDSRTSQETADLESGN